MLVTLWIYDDAFPFGMIVNKDVILAFNLKIKVTMTFVRETEIQQNADLQHGNERER